MVFVCKFLVVSGISGGSASTEMAAEMQFRKLQERAVQARAEVQEKTKANAAAEAAIQELHSSTGKLRASVEDQMVEQRGSIKAAALSMDATRRQVEAYEQDLTQARAAIK